MYELSGQPLANASLADLESSPWPDPYDPARVAGLREATARLYAETEYVLVAYRLMMMSEFELCQQLRGTQNFFEAMVLRPDFASALSWKVAEVSHAGYNLPSWTRLVTMSNGSNRETTWAASAGR